MASGRKVFIGSLPDGVSDQTLREEFSKYGILEDVFIKVPCDPGRQWAMVTYARPEDAQLAKDATDRILRLPGSERPAEVMIAKNQDNQGSAPMTTQMAMPGSVSLLPKKLHIGSLPDHVTEMDLRREFGRFGEITDLFLKTGCERNKQWAIIAFSSGDSAQDAKTKTDRILHINGAENPCEVTIARNQGKSGAPSIASDGPCKIFVGSMPDDITEAVVRDTFSQYGTVTDIYLKTGCESHKQWAFVSFASNAQATMAKEATDRVLRMPNSSKACEVMFAKNQGRNGQDPLNSASSNATPLGALGAAGNLAQISWRVYMSPQGVPYYHNHTTGVTQWECPPDFHLSTMAMNAAVTAQSQQQQQLYGAMLTNAAATPSVMYRPY